MNGNTCWVFIKYAKAERVKAVGMSIIIIYYNVAYGGQDGRSGKRDAMELRTCTSERTETESENTTYHTCLYVCM